MSKKPRKWADLINEYRHERLKLASLNSKEKQKLYLQLLNIKEEQKLSLSDKELKQILDQLIIGKYRKVLKENANIQISIFPILSNLLWFFTTNGAKRIVEFCFSSSFSVNPDSLPLGISFLIRDEEWEGYVIKYRQDWYQNKPLNRWTHLTIFLRTYWFVFMEVYCKTKLGELGNHLNPLHKPRLPRK